VICILEFNLLLKSFFELSNSLLVVYFVQNLIFGTTFAASGILRYSLFLNPYIDANHLPGTTFVITLYDMIPSL